MTLEENEVQQRKREYWGRWFTQMREAAGFRSQQAVADAIGVSRVQVQRWEAGEVRPDEARIPAIAQALSEVATYAETMKAAGYMPDTPPLTVNMLNTVTGEEADVTEKISPQDLRDFILEQRAFNRRMDKIIEQLKPEIQ